MKPFRIVCDEQKSIEWFKARVGLLTGSVASDMLAKIKTGEAAARRDLRTRLVVERLTGEAQEDGFVSKDMQRGADLESDAIAAYELATDRTVQPVGFCAHLKLAAGCSPDGHVNDYEGLVEVKCPKSATHLRYLRSSGVPSDYLPQITHNAWVTGAQWVDFISYDDRFPVSLRLVIRRVLRSELDIAGYELAARQFLSECDAELESVRKLIP